MIDTTIKLVSPEERYQDDYGIWRKKEKIKREIFARMSSIDRTEFYSAGKEGFRPEYRFTVFQAEYKGEKVCDYDGKTYAIYRTYNVPGTDDLELYVRMEAGVANGS